MVRSLEVFIRKKWKILLFNKKISISLKSLKIKEGIVIKVTTKHEIQKASRTQTQPREGILHIPTFLRFYEAVGKECIYLLVLTGMHWVSCWNGAASFSTEHSREQSCVLGGGLIHFPGMFLQQLKRKT